MNKVAELFAEAYGQTREQEMSLQDYLTAIAMIPTCMPMSQNAC